MLMSPLVFNMAGLHRSMDYFKVDFICVYKHAHTSTLNEGWESKRNRKNKREEIKKRKIKVNLLKTYLRSCHSTIYSALMGSLCT